MPAEHRDVVGRRAERIAELALTDYRDFSTALFRVALLHSQWPTIDLYVELTGIPDRRWFFFVQVKGTDRPLGKSALAISTRRRDIESLLAFPAPTYLLGVHVPTQRAWIRSVHQGILRRAMTRIPLEYELTPGNLRRLYDEVCTFWSVAGTKPSASVFP